MTDLPKFKRGPAETKEEKMITDLIQKLGETFNSFVEKNQCIIDDSLFFKVLRDAAIVFSCETISLLSELLIPKTQVPKFLYECQEIFDAYIKDFKKYGKNLGIKNDK